MKNRYCRKTKLSEERFLSILIAYCIGMTASQAAKADAATERPASRQTVERIYLELGDYLYRKYVRPMTVELAARMRDTFNDEDECEKYILDHFWKVMRGELDYAHFRKQNLPHFENTYLVAVLGHRWKVFNGFTRDKFPSHFAFALHRIRDDDPVSFLGTIKTYESFKEMLESDPL